MKKSLSYWQYNVRFVSFFLVIWFLFSICASILFVDSLNYFSFFGAPLGFWIAQQGCIYVFIALICLYSHVMNRLDEDFGVLEQEH